MKKIKKIWQDNKVLLMLAVIIIVCLAIVVFVAFTYFYGSSESVYGDRLDDIENVQISDNLLLSIEETLKANEAVSSVEASVKGKIIYISISFVEETEMESAKAVAESAISLFSEEELSLYDIQFTISSLSTNDFVGYTLMGSRNATGSGIVWGNYNVTSSSEDDE